MDFSVSSEKWYLNLVVNQLVVDAVSHGCCQLSSCSGFTFVTNVGLSERNAMILKQWLGHKLLMLRIRGVTSSINIGSEESTNPCLAHTSPNSSRPATLCPPERVWSLGKTLC